ncbi:family 16 glycosylhydrolase [Candidatus Saccharibacteria bacterium]|nr:family 16 glycosylhydrolase [Candidatus Saccharibacteria bacterium]
MSIKNMSKLQWVVVAVVFVAAISAGGLFARSELSSVKLTTVSPGSLSIPYETSSVISDPATTFKQAVVMYSEGTVTSSNIATTSAATSVEVIAKGSYCRGWPNMNIYIDGKQQGSSIKVGSKTWAKYSQAVNIPAGTHTVSVSYPNDYWRPGRCDRNLYIDSISLYGDTPIVPDVTAPSVKLTAPASGASISGNLTATATATDNDKVQKVEFYADNALLGTVLQSPYTFTTDTTKLANGGHTISAKAYDATGNVATSSATVTVSNNTTPPSTPTPSPTPTPVPSPTPTPVPTTPTYDLNISKPTANQDAVGTVTFSGTQSSGIKNIEIWYNGSNVKTATLTNNTWTAAVDTTKQPNGPQIYTVYAWDVAAGLQATITVTKDITMNVNNPAPAPIPAPTPVPTGLNKGYFTQAAAFVDPVKTSPAIHSDSAAFMTQFKAGNFWNPNFSMGSYGVTVVKGTGAFSAYPSPPPGETSQYLGSAGKIQVPKVPAGTQPPSGTDGHLAVVVGTQVYEIYKATVSADGTVTNAKAVAVANLAGNGQTDRAYAPSNAAGLSLLAGLVTPEELASGHIDHALVFSVPGIKAGEPVFPAWENVYVGNSNTVLREADKIQLDPNVNISGLPEPQKTIAKALQTYGAYLRDNGGTFAIYGETTSRWPAGYGTGFSLKDIPWGSVRVLDYNKDIAPTTTPPPSTVPADPGPVAQPSSGTCSDGGAPCVVSTTEVGTKKWTKDFSDEFNGTSLDSSKWVALRGPTAPGYGDPYNKDAEDAFYKTANTTVEGGNLVMTLKKETAQGVDRSYPYTSGMAQSGRSYSFPPGTYIESNIKVPSCNGCWPAFWTLDTPVDGHWPPEIDIFEFFGTHSDKKPQFNYHWINGGQTGPTPNGNLSDYTGAYHTYGMYWTGSKIVPYIDGVAYGAVSGDITKVNQYIIFNLAIGKGGTAPTNSQMFVDWVRVWKPAN